MDTQKPKQAEIIVIVTPEQRKLVDTRHSHTEIDGKLLQVIKCWLMH